MTEPLVDVLKRALKPLGGQDSALRAQLLARLALALEYPGSDQRQPALAYEALDIVRRVGDKPDLAEVLAASYAATRSPDNLDERHAMAEELALLAAEMGDRGLGVLAANWILTDLLERGDTEAAARELEALTRLAEESQLPLARFAAANARARQAHVEGRLEDYEALAHEVLAVSPEGQAETAMQAFGGQMVFLRREQGRLGELVEPVQAFAERYPAWRPAFASILAELDRRPDARRELDALASDDFEDLPRDWAWLLSIANLSEVAAYLDDARRAELLYQLLLPYADRCVVIDGFCQGSASRPLALLAATFESFDAAVGHFEHALEVNARIKSPLWVAHTQHDYAQTLLRRAHPGDRETALTLFDRALATADKLGLTALADRAERLKRRAEAAPSV